MNNISFKNDILPLKDRLFRLALRICMNREEAEDIVQDTLMRLWTGRAEWDTINNIETYTLTICRNIALDVTRKKERQTLSLDNAAHDMADNVDTPDEALTRQQQMGTVRKLINSLPEKQRTIVQLRDIEGKTYQEIAETMQISLSDVKVNLFRARGKLKEQLTSHK